MRVDVRSAEEEKLRKWRAGEYATGSKWSATVNLVNPNSDLPASDLQPDPSDEDAKRAGVWNLLDGERFATHARHTMSCLSDRVSQTSATR